MTRDSSWGILSGGKEFGWDNGNRSHARAEARPGARLAGGACRCRSPVRDPDLGSDAAPAEHCRRRGTCDSQPDRPLADYCRGRASDQLAGKPGSLFQRRAAAAVRSRLSPVRSGRCDRRPADASAGADGTDRPRVAGRGGGRDPARHCAWTDQRFGGLGPARRVGRSVRPCSRTRPGFGVRPDRKSADCRAGSAGDPASAGDCGTHAWLVRDGTDHPRARLGRRAVPPAPACAPR